MHPTLCVAERTSLCLDVGFGVCRPVLILVLWRCLHHPPHLALPWLLLPRYVPACSVSLCCLLAPFGTVVMLVRLTLRWWWKDSLLHVLLVAAGWIIDNRCRHVSGITAQRRAGRCTRQVLVDAVDACVVN
jgi:hypothetical protein